MIWRSSGGVFFLIRWLFVCASFVVVDMFFFCFFLGLDVVFGYVFAVWLLVGFNCVQYPTHLCTYLG